VTIYCNKESLTITIVMLCARPSLDHYSISKLAYPFGDDKVVLQTFLHVHERTTEMLRVFEDQVIFCHIRSTTPDADQLEVWELKIITANGDQLQLLLL
jgi:hypothetical protein